MRSPEVAREGLQRRSGGRTVKQRSRKDHRAPALDVRGRGSPRQRRVPPPPTDASARGRWQRHLKLQQQVAMVGHGRRMREERGTPYCSSNVEVLFTHPFLAVHKWFMEEAMSNSPAAIESMKDTAAGASALPTTPTTDSICDALVPVLARCACPASHTRFQFPPPHVKLRFSVAFVCCKYIFSHISWWVFLCCRNLFHYKYSFDLLHSLNPMFRDEISDVAVADIFLFFIYKVLNDASKSKFWVFWLLFSMLR